VYTPRRSRIANRRDTPETSGPVFVLNKSWKSEMVTHARNVTYGVVGLSTATQHTARDMENFNRTVHQEGWDVALDTLVTNLSSFAENYNRSSGFMQAQSHSTGLRAFAYEVSDNLVYNRSRLEMLGLYFTESGGLTFDAGRVQSMNFEEINTAIGDTIEIFAGMKSFTQQLLTEPLVSHMRFAGLNYHYNYQRGTMESDGFGLLETGLLYDRVV
jgi:hypothetical protein